MKGTETKEFKYKPIHGVVSPSSKHTEGDQSFGNNRKQRAREKSKSHSLRSPAGAGFIRTSELLQELSWSETLYVSDKLTSVKAHDAAAEDMASTTLVDTKGRLIELTARFRQNVKRMQFVRSVTNGLVTCASGDRWQLGRLSVNTSRSELMFAIVGLRTAERVASL